MGISMRPGLFFILLIFLSGVAQIYAETVSCLSDRKPNCNAPGAACLDPRFIGRDGIVFYFHGKSNEHFSLVSDPKLQINARFISLRPAGRTRDFTWIQALGILYDTQSFSLEATNAEIWDPEIDHLRFIYNGNGLVISEGHLASWESPNSDIKVERTSSKNSVLVTIPQIAEISILQLKRMTEFIAIRSHLMTASLTWKFSFKFYALSSEVEGVLGRTYRPDFENPAKPGAAMPVVRGEDKYRTSSLLSADCASCMFWPADVWAQNKALVMDFGMLDCTGSSSSGHGIVCRK